MTLNISIITRRCKGTTTNDVNNPKANDCNSNNKGAELPIVAM